MKYHELIEKLWQQYAQQITAADKIHYLLEAEGEHVVNDHIAFRTLDDPRVNIEVLAQPFLDAGYVEKGRYDFPVKNLVAKHYEHSDVDAPKIFISQLLAAQFSEWLQNCMGTLLDKVPNEVLQTPEKLISCGTPWGVIHYKDYQRLLQESQYAAWFYAFGFRANHFTVSVNHMKKFDTVEKINQFLKKNNFHLNTENGEVKGSPEDLLEQSSILAEQVPVEFSEGTHKIPACYYEFALRYQDKEGKLFQGFVPASADKIFESTHNK